MEKKTVQEEGNGTMPQKKEEMTPKNWQEVQHLLTHLDDRVLMALIIDEWVEWVLIDYWEYVQPSLSLGMTDIYQWTYEAQWICADVLPRIGYTFRLQGQDGTRTYASLPLFMEQEGTTALWDAIAPSCSHLRLCIMTMMTSLFLESLIRLSHFYYRTYSSASLRTGLIPEYPIPPDNEEYATYLFTQILAFQRFAQSSSVTNEVSIPEYL